ncbi:hypothetical protein FGO68_gene16220 [Halteria grandinella]|uniref:Uncharacterized protein n=1 Tax=Halteria grandinella TaxID=5974 RepID=A0A8J8T414_HALGN|nr:hypothetical protein FGO68_gene16220 [Halteria grandinella]
MCSHLHIYIKEEQSKPKPFQFIQFIRNYDTPFDIDIHENLMRGKIQFTMINKQNQFDINWIWLQKFNEQMRTQNVQFDRIVCNFTQPIDTRYPLFFLVHNVNSTHLLGTYYKCRLQSLFLLNLYSFPCLMDNLQPWKSFERVDLQVLKHDYWACISAESLMKQRGDQKTPQGERIECSMKIIEEIKSSSILS